MGPAEDRTQVPDDAPGLRSRPRCAYLTLGCKVNQYETGQLRRDLAARGFAEVAEGAAADVYVVNTCTVTHQAAGVSRRLVRRLARRSPEALILVTGCWAASDGEAAAALPGVTWVVDNVGKGGIADLLDARFGAAHTPLAAPALGQTRAFLKVQDGCDLHCSFCIIPRVRPRLASRPLDEVLSEARALVAAGHREIVLTGIHLGSYGKGAGGGLAELVRRLSALECEGLRRLRLSSIEAQELTDDLVGALADSPVACRHLHVPLQSGSDAVLGLMRRRYRAARYAAALGRVRAALGDPGFSSDVIVGHPGETEDDFARTLEVCAELGFHRIHRFPYSDRRGTAAAALPDKVPPPVIAARTAELARVAARGLEARARSRLGGLADVLVEMDGAGYTDDYLRVRVAGAAPPSGQIAALRLEAIEGEGIRARWM